MTPLERAPRREAADAGTEIIDISQPLDGRTAPWPGDRPLSVEWTARRDQGAAINLAAVSLSVHTGTHVDGPFHTGEGPVAGDLPLERFIGPAMVLDVRDRVTGDPPLVDASALDGLDVRGFRVLLRTRETVDPAAFPEPFAALSPALCRRLVELGCVLVGTDAPSVDPVDSNVLESHRVLAEAGIPNVENLVLSGVEPGRYTLVAPPLALREADSAPVRAVLIRDTEEDG
ncbi:MAG TPA: cyclase family protein [Longimicrobiales bacterium]|nr:cyclase family protein [Longimicrobiales bacterium]